MKNNLLEVETLTLQYLAICSALVIGYSFAAALVVAPRVPFLPDDGLSDMLVSAIHSWFLSAGSYLAVLAASVAVGGFLGFLFGIPRLLQRLPLAEHALPSPTVSSEQLTPPAATGQSSPISRFAGNTNLEDISDWLTKIIVGLGLTQAGNIYQAFLDAQSRFAIHAMNNAMGSRAMFAAIVLSGLVAGFLFFYLETRTRLTILLASADHYESILSPETGRTVLAKETIKTNTDTVLDEVRITRESPGVGEPTETDRIMVNAPFGELRTVEELAVWGAAQERLGNIANAERAFNLALKMDRNNPKLYLALASINKRLGDNEKAAEVLNDAAKRFSDDPSVLKDTLLTALYVPAPTGYTTALAAADRLKNNFPASMDDPHVQLWIAAANGQKFAYLKPGAEREGVRSAALDAVGRVIQLAPDPESRVRITLRKIFNPAEEGSNPTENDLEVFKDDPEFKALIKPIISTGGQATGSR